MHKSTFCSLALVSTLCWVCAVDAAVVQKDVAALTSESQQIIVGDVVEVRSFWDDDHALIKSRIVVAVDQYLVGQGSGTEVLEMSGGTVGELSLRVSVLPTFEQGDHVLLFLGESQIRLVGCFQGAFLTDGQEAVQMAPGCGSVIPESGRPLRVLLGEIEAALPSGTVLPDVPPYEGEFQLPTAGPRFGLCGQDWTYYSNPMGEDYRINPNCADSAAGDQASQLTQIQNGMAGWNNAGANFVFTYAGTSTQTSVTYNNTNLIFFSLNPPDGGDYVAANYHWFDGGDMLESDIVYNDADYTWWNGSGGCFNKMDIWNIATHELGHSLCLLDLYNSGDSEKTMYGYTGWCETKKRTLDPDDINGIISVYGGSGPNYCDASSNSTSYEYISRVAVGTIDNASGSDGYADYTSLSTGMAIGGGYTITITIGSPYSSDIGGLWVDWNHDSDFFDTNEEITTSWSGNGPYTATITPRADALTGSTRMRVRIQDGDYDPTVDPCGTTSYGEVEDYTITVTGSPDSTPPQPSPMSFALAPITVDASSITMTATEAWDETPPVEYYFDGDHPRDWSTQRTYTDTGLAANTMYAYSVRARDSASPSNLTDWSSPAATATLIEAPTGVSFGTVTTNSVVLYADGTLTNLSVGYSGLYFDSTTDGGDGGLNNWIQTTTDTATGLSPNTPYTFRVRARNQSSIQTSWCPTATKTTLANIPGAPSLTNATSNTLDLDVDPNGNPAGTHFAAQCTSSPDPAWNNHYLNASGNPVSSAVWQTDGEWGTTTLQSLQPETNYCFRVKARNAELVETALSGQACAETLGGAVPGDLNCDGQVDFDDINPFVLALNGQAGYYQEYPDCNWLNADCDSDGDVDFDDINPFVTLLGS